MDINRNENMGKLYIVATPIGNLQDMTFRAVEVLSSVDVIAAEDTRHTIKLLNHYDIKTRLISHHEHNKTESTNGIIMLLSQGKDVALVSDAGMPCVSDPGYELIDETRKQGYGIVIIPGASALPAAVAVSGLNASRFRFEGFLPDKKNERLSILDEISKDGYAVVIYVAPHDLLKTLEELKEFFADRRVAVVKDISKIHERVDVFNIDEAAEKLDGQTIKGEYVLVIEKGEAKQDESWRDMDIVTHVNAEIKKGSLSKMDAIKNVAKIRGVKKGDIYKEYIENDK